MTLLAGSKLGPYEIVSQFGSSGMGVVYRATDPRLKRTVAIKLLPPDLTKDEIAKQRFLQEAQAASALDHPNICTIHEINETDDGQLYLVMAHYEGETIKERIARGPLQLDDAVDIAMQVGEGLADAHIMLGGVLYHYDWDWSGAEREFRLAIDRSPGNAEARAACGQMLVAIGRPDEGLAEGRRAVELDPLSLVTNWQLGLALLSARRFDAAIEQTRRMLELDPAYFPAGWVLAIATAAKGDYQGAVTTLEEVRSAAQGDPILEGLLGWTYGQTGRRDEARALLETLERRRSQRYLSAMVIAWVCAGLDDVDQVFAWLTRAVEDRDGLCVYLATAAPWDPLRSRPPLPGPPPAHELPGGAAELKPASYLSATRCTTGSVQTAAAAR